MALFTAVAGVTVVLLVSGLRFNTLGLL